MKNIFNTFKKTDKTITVTMSILVIFGIFMIISSEMSSSGGDIKFLVSLAFKQLAYFGLGLAVYYFCMTFLSPKKYNRKFYYILAFGLAICLLIPRIMGLNINGAYAWVPIGPFTIQPSEFAKVFIIFFLSNSINNYPDSIKEKREFFFWDSLTCIVLTLIVLLIQRDTGSGIVMGAITVMMLSLCSKRIFGNMAWLMLLITLACFLLVFLAFTTPIVGKILTMIFGADDYRVQRFLSAENPFIYQYDQGYHLVLSLVTFANGGLKGLGYGNSIHKYMNFPNVDNDFILPVIVEELGIGGFLFIILGYGILVFSIIKYLFNKSCTLRTYMVSIGVLAYLLLHFILNVGGVTAILPLTGVPLLMISAGGSSLWGIMGAFGLMQAEIIELGKKK